MVNDPLQNSTSPTILQKIAHWESTNHFGTEGVASYFRKVDSKYYSTTSNQSFLFLCVCRYFYSASDFQTL